MNPAGGKYYLTKGQAVEQVKYEYPDLSRFQLCSRPPDEICSWEDVFIFDDENNSMQYNLVFRDGSGRIVKEGLDREVFLEAYYYYFTVTKDTGNVTELGSFEKHFISESSGNIQFECSGKTFWSIPVTSDCVLFK